MKHLLISLLLIPAGERGYRGEKGEKGELDVT